MNGYGQILLGIIVALIAAHYATHVWEIRKLRKDVHAMGKKLAGIMAVLHMRGMLNDREGGNGQ